MHLFDHTFDHDYYFELPVKGSGIPNQLLGVLLHTMAISGLSRVRTELSQLLVIPFLPHHPVQTNRVRILLLNVLPWTRLTDNCVVESIDVGKLARKLPYGLP